MITSPPPSERQRDGCDTADIPNGGNPVPASGSLHTYAVPEKDVEALEEGRELRRHDNDVRGKEKNILAHAK